jgi:hypothetical protein
MEKEPKKVDIYHENEDFQLHVKINGAYFALGALALGFVLGLAFGIWAVLKIVG